MADQGSVVQLWSCVAAAAAPAASSICRWHGRNGISRDSPHFSKGKGKGWREREGQRWSCHRRLAATPATAAAAATAATS